jgi:hypothetical protein
VSISAIGNKEVIVRNVIFPRMGHLFDVFMGENIGKFKERVMKRQMILLLIWKEYLVLT